MRFFGGFASVFFLLAAVSASELKVKVVDPQSAAVSGARIELSEKGNPNPVAVGTTSAEGVAVFKNTASAPSQIRVLAPGFALETTELPSSLMGTVTVQLRLAPAAETVVVTATRTPITGEESGATVETLNSSQLQVMNPVSANDALRFLPGAVINTAGQRGAISSLFVRGGESTYNKVIVDGVTINQPGGTFDFGTLPLEETDRLEFVKGAQSTLYGSDAMTSVVQVWTRTGSTENPELRFGADGGNFSVAHGYTSLSGARDIFDYNLFGDQFNTNGQGVNNGYSDSLQGANLGVKVSDEASLRFRTRHSDSQTGLPGAWEFNGVELEPPDPNNQSHLNTLLGSLELDIATPSGWQHRLTGFDYKYHYTNVDLAGDPDRVGAFPSDYHSDINRAGFEYQGDYTERSWAQTTFGYRFEDENGHLGDLQFLPQFHGLRLNHDAFVQQQVTLGRLSAVAGARFVHNDGFGNTGVPRIALTLLALRGGEIFSGTRLRFSYATGIKEPSLDQTFAGPPNYVYNPGLKPERNRAFEAGFLQNFLGNKYFFSATYFNNLYHDRIDAFTDPTTFVTQFVNVDKSFARGAEIEFQGKIRSNLSWNSAYTYTSTQILDAPVCTPANFCNPTVSGAGEPLLRRPKHMATTSINYLAKRWGGNLGGSFVGRRKDWDYSGFNIDHAAGYARVDLGGWYTITSRVTAYANLENALDKHYNEVVGYPALGVNFRAGMRFRIGGE